MREQAFLPAGQEDGLELQALGRMQRHDRDGVELGVLLGVHDQRDMFEEGAQRLVLLHASGSSSFRFSSRPGASAERSFFHMSV